MSSRTRWFSDPLWYLLFCAAFLSLWCLQMDVDRAVRIRWYQNRAISTLQDSGCFGWALACKMSCTGFERERERSGLESSGGSAFSLPQRLTDARMWKWTSNHRCPSWKTCCRWFVVVLARLFEKRLHKNTKQIFGSSESVLDAQSRGTSWCFNLTAPGDMTMTLSVVPRRPFPRLEHGEGNSLGTNDLKNRKALWSFGLAVIHTGWPSTSIPSRQRGISCSTDIHSGEGYETVRAAKYCILHRHCWMYE